MSRQPLKAFGSFLECYSYAEKQSIRLRKTYYIYKFLIFYFAFRVSPVELSAHPEFSRFRFEHELAYPPKRSNYGR